MNDLSAADMVVHRESRTLRDDLGPIAKTNTVPTASLRRSSHRIASGQTIDFLLSPKRDAAAAKRFFRKTLLDPANPQPRVINVDKNPAYPAAVEELEFEGTLRRAVDDASAST